MASLLVGKEGITFWGKWQGGRGKPQLQSIEMTGTGAGFLIDGYSFVMNKFSDGLVDGFSSARGCLDD